MASEDVQCIMNLLKEVSDVKNVKDVKRFILDCFEILTVNLIEREDNKRMDLTEEYEQKIADRDILIKDLQMKTKENFFSIDSQAQYNRSENIKIHGIEYKKGENTNDIVKDVAKYCGVEIKDTDLSTSHRIMSRVEMDSQINPSNRDTKIPVIIARVNRRDLKVQLLEAKKNISTNIHCPVHLKNAQIYEDVTPLRSRMMYHLRQRNDKQAFRYVWSKGGRIYARTPEDAALPREQQPKPHIFNTPDDLKKVGFTEKEIVEITNNVRN